MKEEVNFHVRVGDNLSQNDNMIRGWASETLLATDLINQWVVTRQVGLCGIGPVLSCPINS